MANREPLSEAGEPTNYKAVKGVFGVAGGRRGTCHRLLRNILLYAYEPLAANGRS